MKKFTAILMAMILALFVVSCGDSDDDKDNNKQGGADTGDTDKTDTADTADSADSADSGDTGDTGDSGCKIGNELFTLEGVDRYFAFKGVGTINKADALNDQNSEAASMVAIDFDGIPDADYTYGPQLSFYESAYSKMFSENAVIVNIVGNITSGQHITNITEITVPLSYLEFMKENKTFELSQAPATQVNTIKWSKKERYAMQCVYMSKLVDQKYFNGKMKVCYKDSDEFVQGETFKMNMVAEMGSDQDTADMFSNIDSAEDICMCFDTTVESTNDEDSLVDCATVDWEEKGDAGDTGDTDTGDTDTGDSDTGDSDTGDSDTGDSDTGDSDTGDSDTGDSDTGDSDTGDSDTGDSDTEECQSNDDCGEGQTCNAEHHCVVSE